MILAIDIGNTTVSFAVMSEINDQISISLDKEELSANSSKVIKGIKKEYPDINLCTICSVVPKMTKVIAKKIRESFKVKVKIIGRDIKVPIKNKYKDPKQVGQDRLVCAYAAKKLFGSPLIIIDFGTAITFDLISKNGSYEGGIIVPGIRLTAEALFKKTALLPEIKDIRAPSRIIGKDTESSILSGIFFGYGSLCDGLIAKLSKDFKTKPKVVATGGYTHMMQQYMSRKLHKIDENLIFKGISLLS